MLAVWAVLLLAGGVVAVAIWTALRLRLRARRFRRREAVSPEEWFRRFLPLDAEHRAPAEEILSALGREIGVEWMRFRPDDTFSRTFCLPYTFMRWMDDDSWGGFEVDLDSWISKHGVDDLGIRFPDRLDEFLVRLLEMRGSHRSP